MHKKHEKIYGFVEEMRDCILMRVWYNSTA